MNNRRMRAKGFTLVEMMITVAIIGLLAVVAIPNWVRARSASQKEACVNNLRQISGAMQQWALDFRKGPGSPVEPADVLPYLKNAVVCPAGGAAATFGSTYTLETVADAPTCRIVPEHLMPTDTIN